MASLLGLPQLQRSCCGSFKLKEIWNTTAMKSSSRSNCTQHWLDGTRKISRMAPATCRKHPGTALTAEMSLRHCPGLGAGRLRHYADPRETARAEPSSAAWPGAQLWRL